jgi:hypothetical protein
VIYENNIKREHQKAADDIAFDPAPREGSEKGLTAGDIVVCAKGGDIAGDNAETIRTEEGSYYVIREEIWGRFVTNLETCPWEVAATKDTLILLSKLNGEVYLAMTPDEPPHRPRTEMPPKPTDPGIHINCYVLNLASFRIRDINAQ